LTGEGGEGEQIVFWSDDQRRFLMQGKETSDEESEGVFNNS
jgi:hypothetical protein